MASASTIASPPLAAARHKRDRGSGDTTLPQKRQQVHKGRKGSPVSSASSASSANSPSSGTPVFDPQFVGLNMLAAGGRVHKDLSLRIDVPYQDLASAIGAMSAMNISICTMWAVQKYAHPCNEAVTGAEADDGLLASKVCGVPGSHILRNGRFVCKDHVPPATLPNGKANSAAKHVVEVDPSRLFTGIIVLGKTKLRDCGVRAHIAGTVKTLRGDAATAFELAVDTALQHMRYEWEQTAERTCTTLRVEVGQLYGDTSARVFFQPTKRQARNAKVSGLRVVEQNMVLFPTVAPPPRQMVTPDEVVMLWYAYQIKDFGRVFNKLSGDRVELFVERAVPTKKGVFPEKLELSTVTMRSCDSDNVSISGARQSLVSALKQHRVKPITADKDSCAVGASTECAVTRVEDTNLTTDDVIRMLQRAGREKGLITPEVMMKTQYPLARLTQLFSWVSKQHWVTSVPLFAQRAPSPLVMLLRLPGGVLQIAISTFDAEEEEAADDDAVDGVQASQASQAETATS